MSASCFLIKQEGGSSRSLSIEVVYVYPMVGDYSSQARAFANSYLSNEPCAEHITTVVCNGGSPNQQAVELFSKFPGIRFIEHDNSGYDIGAFQRASSQSTADMIVFFGTSAYVRRKGWLQRMAQVFASYGQGQYGAMGNRGNFQSVFPHIRTTGFWTTPDLFNSYPTKITKPEQRFPFEHGPHCFTSWVTKKGFNSWVVTYSGIYLWENWDCPNGFHNGSQSELLCGDKITRPPYYHTP